MKILNEATGKVGHQTKMLNIVPLKERADGKIILTNEKNRTVKSRKYADLSSPLKKKSDGQQNTSYARKDLFGSKQTDKSTTDLLSEMQTLMPSVIDNLNETGRTETFRKFVKMVNENRFPLKNIAWLLFLDVVDYGDSDNAVGMSYNNRVTVLFWKIGYKLMHGKFLRYCGGFKNQGQVTSGATEKGYYSPENASINFAVPDLKTLQKEETYIDINHINPGIINDTVETFSQGAEHKTYKVCVDGKKINGCNDSPAGQINMFGYEGPPSIQERENRMQSEQTLIHSFVTFLEELDVKNKIDFCSLSDTDRDTLLEFVKQTVLLFSTRIKDVREHRVKKENALTKFKKLGENDWRKSKYAIVISHIQTWMYQGNSSVESILSNLDKLCCAIAQANDLPNCYHESVVDLGHQENYICLQEADSAIP